MWQEAWSLFLENPWTGAGTGAFHDEVISNTRSQIVGNYEHAHSDYFTSMGTKGIIGLFSLILLLGILPIALSKNSMRIMGNKWDAALFSAIIFSVGFFIFGLTETMFIHSLVISWYTVVAASILAMGKTLNTLLLGKSPRFDQQFLMFYLGIKFCLFLFRNCKKHEAEAEADFLDQCISR